MKYDDRTMPMDKHFETMVEKRGFAPAPPAPQMFGNAGREYMERYGTSAESFARIGEKNHRHSVNNPYSQFQDEYSLQDILDAPMVHEPLTKLQCCPTSDGGAAVIVASERFVREHGLEAQAIEIVAQAMTTDFPSSFEGSDMSLVGFDMTKAAADKVYEESGLGPEDVDVVELHDCFSANEMITYEGLGLCDEGKAGDLIDSGAVTYGGDVVVNPSGGLISKGHPLGATGLAQCAELNWQLRGKADKRQVDGAKVGLQHNLGLGGAAVVTMYRKPE
jgi:acetyl-CoA acetyltransferase